MGKGTGLLIGTAIGAILGKLAIDHPAWVMHHPGTIMGCGAALILATGLYVQLRMNRVVVAHEQREESFRLEMLAMYAPELLAKETAADEVTKVVPIRSFDFKLESISGTPTPAR